MYLVAASSTASPAPLATRRDVGAQAVPVEIAADRVPSAAGVIAGSLGAVPPNCSSWRGGRAGRAGERSAAGEHQRVLDLLMPMNPEQIKNRDPVPGTHERLAGAGHSTPKRSANC